MVGSAVRKRGRGRGREVGRVTRRDDEGDGGQAGRQVAGTGEPQAVRDNGTAYMHVGTSSSSGVGRTGLDCGPCPHCSP